MKLKYVSWDECADGASTYEVDIPGAEHMRPDHVLIVINELHAEVCESEPLYLSDPYGYKVADPGWIREVEPGMWELRGWWSDRPKEARLIWCTDNDAARALRYAEMITLTNDGGE